MNHNTLFMRLEGALQSWGVQESKFVIRRTSEAPTKSGIIGLLCAALGVSRKDADGHWLPELNKMTMGVRIDRPGIRWWDYHTVGAGMRMCTAESSESTKPGAMLTKREYLCDASFLVALQGPPGAIGVLEAALERPKWTLFLGRKSCPPALPLLNPKGNTGSFVSLEEALSSRAWCHRLASDPVPESLKCFIEWKASASEPEAPLDALVHYDAPVTFQPPAHGPRFVLKKVLGINAHGQVKISREQLQNKTPRPPRPRANYTDSQYQRARNQRLKDDQELCVFCKMFATTVHHITYKRAGGDEHHGDLRSLCRLCHDAVTMLEYGTGMGMDRIDPCLPEWRNAIIRKRDAIVKFRSIESRRRRLEPEEVE